MYPLYVPLHWPQGPGPKICVQLHNTSTWESSTANLSSGVGGNDGQMVS